jgi:hypothetical protein
MGQPREMGVNVIDYFDVFIPLGRAPIHFGRKRNP